MTPLDLPALRAILPSDRLVAQIRDDGTVYVYSPSHGILRVVVPFAETTTEFADLIVALPALLAELEAARLAVGAVRKHLESDEARFAGMEDPFSYVDGSIGAFVEALSAYDAATNGGG